MSGITISFSAAVSDRRRIHAAETEHFKSRRRPQSAGEQLAAEDGPLPSGQIGRIQEIPNGHSRWIEDQKRKTTEGEDACTGLHRGYLPRRCYLDYSEAWSQIVYIIQTTDISPSRLSSSVPETLLTSAVSAMSPNLTLYWDSATWHLRTLWMRKSPTKPASFGTRQQNSSAPTTGKQLRATSSPTTSCPYTPTMISSSTKWAPATALLCSTSSTISATPTPKSTLAPNSKSLKSPHPSPPSSNNTLRNLHRPKATVNMSKSSTAPSSPGTLTSPPHASSWRWKFSTTSPTTASATTRSPKNPSKAPSSSTTKATSTNSTPGPSTPSPHASSASATPPVQHPTNTLCARRGCFAPSGHACRSRPI